MNSNSVAVTCTSCGAATTVPFTPTPGRPVYCSACFAKAGGRSAGGGGGGRPEGGGPRRGPFRPPENDLNRTAPRKHMLAQGRKGHFVYDAMEILSRSNKMPEDERRAFVETLFTKGARQSSQAAYEFLVEKHKEQAITEEEAKGLDQLLDRYSFRR